MRLALVLALALLLAPASVAASIVVTALDDELLPDGDCSLREAIEAAQTDTAVDGCNAGEPGADAITFEETLPAGTLDLTLGPLVVTDDFSIDGRVADGAITLSGTGIGRIFRLEAGNMTLSTLTLVDGRAESGGAIRVGPDATLTVALDVTFERNAATGGSPADGGGALLIDGGTVVVQDVLMLRANTAVGSGGAILMRGGTFSHDGGSVRAEENVAAVDGGALALTDGADVDLNAYFQANIAGRDGGAVHATGGSQVDLRSSEVYGNRAGDRGGAIWNDAIMAIRGTRDVETLGDNEAAGVGGGAVYNEGTLDLIDATLTRNRAVAPMGQGGGVLAAAGSVTMVGGALSDNEAGGQGAGLASTGAEVRLEGVVVIANGLDQAEAPLAGGGLYASGGTLTLVGGVVSSNRARAGGGLWTSVPTSGASFDGPADGFDSNVAERGGAVFVASGSVTALRDVEIESNAASAEGGGVFVDAGGALEITDSDVFQNTASVGGGGVAVDGGRLTLMRASVRENAVPEGGPGPSRGGGLYNPGGEVEVFGSSFDTNRAGQGGGIWSDGTLLLAPIEGVAMTGLTGNEAYGTGEADGGGGLYAAGQSAGEPTVVAELTTFSANFTAGSGGGLFIGFGARVEMERSLVEWNEAARDGAGVALYDVDSDFGSPRLSFTDGTITENGLGDFGPVGSPARGGGIYAGGENSVTLLRSTVYGNEAGEGGGIWATGFVELAVYNSTVSRNRATGDGGGIYVLYQDTIGLLSTTITENVAGWRGGGLFGSDGGALMFEIRNVAMGGNEAPEGPDCFGGPASSGHNAIADTSECTLQEVKDSDILGVPLLLGPLALNGGRTLTHLPLAGSPLIDAGDSVFEVDQRGAARGYGGADDIGAVEFDGRGVAVTPTPTPEATLALGPPTPNPTAGRVTLAVAAAGAGRIEVFDVLGQRVRALDLGAAPSEVALDVSGLAAGVYVVRLTTEAGQATRRLTVVR